MSNPPISKTLMHKKKNFVRGLGSCIIELQNEEIPKKKNKSKEKIIKPRNLIH